MEAQAQAYIDATKRFKPELFQNTLGERWWEIHDKQQGITPVAMILCRAEGQWEMRDERHLNEEFSTMHRSRMDAVRVFWEREARYPGRDD